MNFKDLQNLCRTKITNELAKALALGEEDSIDVTITTDKVVADILIQNTPQHETLSCIFTYTIADYNLAVELNRCGLIFSRNMVVGSRSLSAAIDIRTMNAVKGIIMDGLEESEINGAVEAKQPKEVEEVADEQ